jgi:hypothetical protein
MMNSTNSSSVPRGSGVLSKNFILSNGIHPRSTVPKSAFLSRSVSHPTNTLTTPSQSHSSPLLQAPHSISSYSHNRWTNIRLAVTESFSPSTPRKPIAGNEINPSIYRPHVPASHRIFQWSSPHCERAQIELDHHISQRLQISIFRSLSRSVVPETLESYGAGLLRFHQFCDREQIPEAQRMPASYILLSAFISDFAGKQSGKTIRSWLSGLRMWHLVNHAEWHGDDKWVLSLRKSADRAGVVFSLPPRHPITIEHLRTLRENLDLGNSLHASIWFVAISSFSGCRRLGELIVKSPTKMDTSRIATHSSHTHESTVNGRRILSLNLPWTKSTSIKGGHLLLVETGDDLCPIWAHDNHIRLNAPSSSDGDPAKIPFTSFQCHNRLVPLTRSTFLAITCGLIC